MNLYKLLCLDVIIYFFFDVCLYPCTTIQSTRIPTRERMSRRDWRGERVTQTRERKREERGRLGMQNMRDQPHMPLYTT